MSFLFVENYWFTTTSSSLWFSTPSFLHTLLLQTPLETLRDDSSLHITWNPPLHINQWTAPQPFLPQIYKGIKNNRTFLNYTFYFEIIVGSHAVVRNGILYTVFPNANVLRALVQYHSSILTFIQSINLIQASSILPAFICAYVFSAMQFCHRYRLIHTFLLVCFCADNMS